MLDALAPAELAIPDTVLTLMAPGATNVTPSVELFASRTRPAFDELGAARTLAQMIIDMVLQRDRAARLVEFATRGSGQHLTLGGTIDALVRARGTRRAGNPEARRASARDAARGRRQAPACSPPTPTRRPRFGRWPSSKLPTCGAQARTRECGDEGRRCGRSGSRSSTTSRGGSTSESCPSFRRPSLRRREIRSASRERRGERERSRRLTECRLGSEVAWSPLQISRLIDRPRTHRPRMVRFIARRCRDCPTHPRSSPVLAFAQDLGCECVIRKLGVVGAGTMGGGIAALAASAGIPVVLLDVRRKTATETRPARRTRTREEVEAGGVHGRRPRVGDRDRQHSTTISTSSRLRPRHRSDHRTGRAEARALRAAREDCCRRTRSSRRTRRAFR